MCSGRVPTRVRGQINIQIPVAPVRCSSLSPRAPPAVQGMVYNSSGSRGGIGMIATQRAVRGPRPASPCTHLRGAPAATLANHHIANGVENRRWGDSELGCPGPRARRPRTLQSTQHKTMVTARCGGGAQEQQGPKAHAPRPCCPNHTRALATRHREKEVALGMHGGYRVAGHLSTLTKDPINVDAVIQIR